jgi:hypothetical protein
VDFWGFILTAGASLSSEDSGLSWGSIGSSLGALCCDLGVEVAAAGAFGSGSSCSSDSGVTGLGGGYKRINENGTCEEEKDC